MNRWMMGWLLAGLLLCWGLYSQAAGLTGCAAGTNAGTDAFESTLAEESGGEQVIDQLDWDIQSILKELGLDVSDPSQVQEKFTLSAVWETLSDYVSGRIEQPFQMLGGLLTVILFSALLQGLYQGNIRKGTGTVFEFVCTLAAVAVLADPLCQSFSSVETSLQSGAEFMTLFVPVFAGILAAGGTVGSAVCYQTGVIALADGIIQLICHVLLPICTMVFALAIVDAVSPSVSVGGLLHMTKRFSTWVLGLIMTIFLGVLSMQSWVNSSVDTAAAKTTKYVISNFVPVVGSAVSDAYTTVRSSLQILRNTTGVIGMMALCILFLPPLVQLLLYRAVVAVGAALAEVLGTKRLLRLLQGTQQALAIAFALLICFGIMFVVATAIAMTIGKGMT